MLFPRCPPPRAQTDAPAPVLRPSLAPLFVDAVPPCVRPLVADAQHSMTLHDAWVWTPPPARRALSDLVVPTVRSGESMLDVQRSARGGSKTTLDGVEGAAVVDQDPCTTSDEPWALGGSPLHLATPSAASWSLSSARGAHFGFDDGDGDDGDSFVALAALHDPSLFASPSAVPASSLAALEPQTAPRGRRRSVRVDEWGSRAVSMSRERETSLARSACSTSWSKKVGAKAGPSVGVQEESASRSPVDAGSPVLSASHSPDDGRHGRKRSATVACPSSMPAVRSPAADSLSRLASTSPPTNRSAGSVPTSPSSPPRRRVPIKRRYSIFDKATSAETRRAETESGSDRTQFPPTRQYGSLASLSRCLNSSQRAALPTATHADNVSARETSSSVSRSPTATSSTPTASSSTTPSPTSTHASTLDLRHLAAESYRALAHGLSHLPLPHALHLSPPSSPRSPSPSAELAPWESIRALRVRFRPAREAEHHLNAWLLGLTDLARGGTREWDPRALAAERGAEGRGGGGGWPTVSASVGSPPSVEVEFVGGGRREFDPRRMEQDEIMRAVLIPPLRA